MNTLAAAHDAAVQIIDTFIVRVYQHGGRIADNKEHYIGRSPGGLMRKIDDVVDTDGLPVHLGVTAGRCTTRELLNGIASRERCCWQI
jgi:hypothetical protein